MRSPASTLLLLALSGCCTAPWVRFPEKTPPDRSCTTGSAVQGTDVYIWECLRGQKVVVSQYSAEMTCQSATREVLACGARSTLEADPSLDCHGPRAGFAWVP